MKITALVIPIIVLSGCATGGGGLTGSGGATEISLGSIDDVEATGLSYAPYNVTVNGVEKPLIKAFLGSTTYSDGSNLYTFTFGSDGESFVMNAASISGTYFGSFLSGVSSNVPSSGTASYSGNYSGSAGGTYGGIGISGDVYILADFSSSEFSGSITNRSVQAQSGADNDRLADALTLSGDIERDGYLSGFAYNNNAFGSLDGIFFGTGDGAVGTIYIVQENSIWGAPKDMYELGAFTVD